MPIRAEDRDRYPDNWRDIADWVKWVRAGGRCECDGRCGRHRTHLDTDERCAATHGEPSPITGVTVILTTAHLDHTPENVDGDNLMAMCQACHLHYDRDHHRQTRQRTAEQRTGMESLW